MADLFAYGTLMCDDIMEEVSGCRVPGVPATLRGYSRRAVQGEAYPALVAAAGGRVEGVVYRDPGPAAWERLDRFEGEMYARRAVPVELGDGTVATAETYVVRPAFSHRLEEAEWDFGEFLRCGKDRFQRAYRGYREL